MYSPEFTVKLEGTSEREWKKVLATYVIARKRALMMRLRRSQMVGCDFDGVETYLKSIKPNYIISGRHVSRMEETKNDLISLGLNSNKINIILSANEGNVVYVAMFKAHTINSLGLKVYYEDHPLIAYYLKGVCINTNIKLLPSTKYDNSCLQGFLGSDYYKELMF